MFKITKEVFKNKVLFILIFTLVFNILGIGNTSTIVRAASLPKITSVKIADKNPKSGIYPTLQLTSAGSPSVQYSVYVYSKTKKTWENVSGGYTSAVKGNGTYSLKLKKPLENGENSYSVWVKRSGQPPTDKGGYDHFQSYKVTANGSTTTQSIPTIKSADIALSEQKVGVNPNLKVVSSGNGKVQYRVFLYSKDKKVWEDVTNGYTANVNAGSTTSLKLTKPMQSGENSFSIWVKRSGQTPINKEGYDNFLSYKVVVGSTDVPAPSPTPETLPTVKSANIDDSEQKSSVIPTLKLTSTGSEKVQYRVFLYSPSAKKWIDISGGYTEGQDPSKEFNLKSNTPLHKGENSFSIWVKRNGKTPAKKEGYDNFLSYKINAMEEPTSPAPAPTPPASNVIPEITSVNINSSEVKIGESPTITLKSSGDTPVQYSVFLYSQSKGTWEDVSGGYTSSVDPEKPFNIKITKPLQHGRNNFSIWVKRDGMTPNDPGGYDTFVNEAVNVDVDPKTSAKILNVTPNTAKITVGALPSVTVKGSTGDGKNISYKAFLYSNSQRKWLDASSYTSAKSNAETTINLSTPLEAGSNKILVWAKKSSLTGEVHESYQTVEIDAIRPKPMKQRIVIDPGHGGKDPGTINYATGSREKIVALAVSLKLGAILESNGYEILYTRTDNDNVAWDSSNKNESLKYRYTFANTNGADLFVSIHCNSFNGSETGHGTANGVEVLYSKIHPNKDKALATTILQEYLKTTGMNSRGIKNHANWQVVNHTKMPASLVELGFLDNQLDELKLKDPAFQQKAAQGVANGIMKYLNK